LVVVWLTQHSVCRKICVCVYCGLRWYHSLTQRRFFSFIKHTAQAMATQTASVSLNMFSRPDPRAK